MPIKKSSLVLNTEDPEQNLLHQFVNFLPNGKKRNSSAFLRMLVDREYQKQNQQTSGIKIRFE
ncbi:hypothetical protein AWM68_20655 [Fictibacillus phosphorivorans]|uniref:Uncharacterized protein n=1 Tax=Fictibacillus phosphorivorans TaxID=1221500 RepID=A0A165NDW8_9BACL|nr:hypothetical protein [Fictibacillus phosphorivorans]KZE65615.1 hypothetical protein AWM68_20655 [Fictibacillus phosphorivorans]